MSACVVDAAAGIDLVAERSRFGGLERWLDDPAVTEVIVNAGRDVWVERDGCLQRAGTMRPAAVLGALEQILAPIGRRLDRASPTVDARLPDGSRVCAVDPPGRGRRSRRWRSVGSPSGRSRSAAFAPPDVVDLLARLVARSLQRRRQRGDVVAARPRCSTRWPGWSARASGSSRWRTLAELRLAHDHVVRLETRPASPDGVGEVTLAELLRTALRLRPDRLVVGEVRGSEAVDLLQAMNTGHDGSLATVHANSADDAVDRLASLVVRCVPGWPIDDVRAHVGRAVDVIVHVGRDAEGRRRVAHIAELSGTGAPRLLSDGATVAGELRRARR